MTDTAKSLDMDGSKQPLLPKGDPTSTTIINMRYRKTRLVTVQPCMLLYFIAGFSLNPLTDQYIPHYLQQQQLRKLAEEAAMTNASTITPDHNASTNADNTGRDAQSEAALIMILFSILINCTSLFSTVHLGGLSDHIGRKPPLLLSLIGTSIRCVMSAAIVYFELPVVWFAVPYLIDGCMGTAATFCMACFTYIVDVTHHGNRSVQVCVLDFMIYVGIVISSISAGYLIKYMGFFYPFLVLLALHLVNLFYIIMFIDETVEKHRYVEYFTFEYFRRLAKLYIQDDGTGRLKKLIITMLVLAMIGATHYGGFDMLILYQLHAPISFNSVDIGVWTALYYLIGSVPGIIIVKALKNHVSDVGFMFTGNLWSVINYVALALTYSKFTMYLALMSAMFNTLGISMVRSYCSKIVDGNLQGILFSALGIIQAASKIIGVATFNSIYAATVGPEHFSGTAFITEAGIMVLCLLIMIPLFSRNNGRYLP